MKKNKIRTVKEIRKLIDEVMLPGYSYKTNFSSSDFLVDINYNLVISANLVKEDNKMIYKFILDTQFLSSREITYDELKMLTKIIDILEDNRKFVLSRLKKYTVEEWEEEEIIRKKRSDEMLEALKMMLEGHMKKN